MKRERISSTTELMMNWVAWGVYAMNFLVEIVMGWVGIGLIASVVFMIFAYTSFAIWFILKGVNVFSPKLVGNFLFGAAISAIPIINMFYISLDKKTGIPTPGIRKNIGKIIALIQKEDAQYNSRQGDTKKVALQQQRSERLQQIRAQQQTNT